ncbi:MAG: cyclase family protein [Anaerolineales bacterium]|nr:cyclase family protein [Anaerolineales bacterium]
MTPEIIDLTKLLDESLYIYSEENYSDPPLQIEPWCSVQSQGYKVSRVSLGTQCGTHIDAPSHFMEGGADLGALPVEALLGKYFLLDLDQVVRNGKTKFDYREEPILFLKSSGGIEIPEDVFNSLLALPCRVWIIIYDIRISGRDIFYFNRALAEADKYLVENVDEIAAMQVKSGGEIFALPLRLTFTSGAPCRVIVRQE